MDGLLVGLLASVVAYGGLETVTIAAAESQDPVKGVARAVKTTMWRIAIVYVGSMLVIVTLLPWNDPAVTTSGPYAATLDHLGIPAAGEIMNVVILIALLSAMNANIYGSSRMAYSLVARGQGPRALGKVGGGVPRRAVLASCGFGFVTVLLSYWYPDTLFAWLLNMVGGVILIVWGFIAVSQFVLRRLPGAGGAREAGRADVGLPVPDLGRAGRGRRGAGADGPGRGHPGAGALHRRADRGPGGDRVPDAAPGGRPRRLPSLVAPPSDGTSEAGLMRPHEPGLRRSRGPLEER